MVCEAFRSYGHTIGAVNDGQSALTAIQAKKTDLLILDCNMPDMGGLTALQTIRVHPVYWTMPIMMLTGNRADTDRDIALYSGADAYVTKPFDPEILVFKAEDIIKEHVSKPGSMTGRFSKPTF